ncbi:MAG: GDSL-type esterase/lipase family protein [Candidatus Zambryskibacteria bacterium]|nr:GDSL-type esterase/lipase family protein [Candidatus Zambryskibacteria bacterium]
MKETGVSTPVSSAPVSSQSTPSYVTEDKLNQVVNSLKQSLIVQSNGYSTPASNFQAIALSQKIDQLTNTVINTPTITNASLAGTLSLGSALSVANGGTGANSVEGVRSVLGLGYASTVNITSVTNIATWGDSLTASSGGSGTTYPNKLSDFTGRTVYNGGVGGESSTSIKLRMIADNVRRDWGTIIWVGRNNYSDPVTVKADIAAMVASLGHTRYLVLSILNGTGELSGSAKYNTIIQLNNDLATIYGSHYVDVRSYLVSQYNSGIPQDVTDRANDVPPSSLRSDSLHLNAAGYTAVANKVYQNISLLNQLTSDASTRLLTTADVVNLLTSPPVAIGSILPNRAIFSTLAVGTSTPQGSVIFQTGNGSVLLNSNASSTTAGFQGEFGNPLLGQSGGFRFNKNSGSAGDKIFSTYHSNSGSEFYQEVVSAAATKFIFTSGNIGVATTTPDARLSIRGSISGKSFNVYDAFNTETLTVLDSGNIGIGSSSPSAKLSVRGGGAGTGRALAVSNSSNVEKFTVLDNGNVEVGTMVPSGNLEVWGNTPSMKLTQNPGLPGSSLFSVSAAGGTGNTAGISLGNAYVYQDTNGGHVAFGSDRVLANAKVTIYTIGTASMITSGNVGVASTTPWRTLSITGTVGFDGLTAGAGASSLCLSANKEVTYSAGATCTVSSGRFKYDITSASTGLEFVNKLRPVTFKYNKTSEYLENSLDSSQKK